MKPHEIDYEWLLEKINKSIDKISCCEELRVKVGKLTRNNFIPFSSSTADLDEIISILVKLNPEIEKIKDRSLRDTICENSIIALNKDFDDQFNEDLYKPNKGIT